MTVKCGAVKGSKVRGLFVDEHGHGGLAQPGAQPFSAGYFSTTIKWRSP